MLIKSEIPMELPRLPGILRAESAVLNRMIGNVVKIHFDYHCLEGTIVNMERANGGYICTTEIEDGSIGIVN